MNDKATLYELVAEIYDLPFKEGLSEVGISTGLNHFDELIGGLRKGELIIVAARPSVGKTAFALNAAIHAARNGTNVMFFSLEMPRRSITYRLAAHVGNINLNCFKKPIQRFNEQDKRNWSTVLGQMSELKISIFDEPAQTIAEIRSKIRKEIREEPNQKHVVFIDYLSLIRADNPNAIPNVQVSQISRGLKEIAREFDIPVVAISQLSRPSKGNEMRKPMLNELRDSGSIEQDADIVVFLYREGYFDKKKMVKEDVDKLEIIIAKNRQGAIGTSIAYYDLSRGIIRQ